MTNHVRQTLLLALLAGVSLYPVAAQAQARGGAATYTCEGSAASIVSNDLTGTQRNEWPINFRMNVNRPAGSAMIFAVSGITVIKPGRHTIAADRQGRMALSWTWIDPSNVSQTVTLTVTRTGEFEGAWSQSNPLDRTPFGGMFGVTMRGTFSGVCWQ